MRTIFWDFITFLNIENEMVYSQTIQTEDNNISLYCKNNFYSSKIINRGYNHDKTIAILVASYNLLQVIPFLLIVDQQAHN